MPGDCFVPNLMAMVASGVTIKGSPEAVWPWSVQIGAGRAGWYSHDKAGNHGDLR